MVRPSKATVKGVRSDKLRRLLRAARDQGWTLSLDGAGHVRARNPETGVWFSVSTTAPAPDRHYKNARASARRAGLDVTGL